MIGTSTRDLDYQPMWLTVDGITAIVTAVESCHESDIFLTTYLGNILNHVYWFKIGSSANTEITLLKDGIQVHFEAFTVVVTQGYTCICRHVILNYFKDKMFSYRALMHFVEKSNVPCKRLTTSHAKVYLG